MPVPTETFRSPRTLNLIFAASALALLLSVLWMVQDDYNREYRQWQRDGRIWQIAMTRDIEVSARDARTQERIDRVKAQVAELRSSLAQGQAKTSLDDKEQEIARYTAELDKITLRAATFKGEIGPLEQQIQNARLEVPVDEKRLGDLKDRLSAVKLEYRKRNERIVKFQQEIDKLAKQRDEILAEQTLRTRELNELTRQLKSLTEKLTKLEPTRLDDLLGDTVRDAPLLDWLNPYEKPDQIVVPQVLTDVNTMLIETIDRCRSCHVNIDNPQFTEHNVLQYAERQLARAEGQGSETPHPFKPVVMLDFWVHAALAEGRPLAHPLDKAAIEALEKIGETRRQASQPALPAAGTPKERREQVMAEFESIAAGPQDVGQAVPRRDGYAPIAYFLADVKKMLADHVDPDQFKLLRELYRHELLERLNVHRRKNSQPQLMANSVMLAHPRLELFVDSDSPHAAKTMGCTVCHEGSGQETIFEHTVHTPRDIWVDGKSGAPVPDFLIHRGSPDEVHGAEHAVAHGEPSPDAVEIVPVAYKSDRATPIALHGVEHHEATIHDGVNLNNEADPAPFAPQQPPHDTHPTYAPPGNEVANSRPVVRQQEFWTSRYGWSHTHYAMWEKPMHKLDYVESSCNKCHTQVFDLKDTAPRLYEGRRLFASIGCINCHSVADIEDNLDLRRVGPSLVHVKHKLSPSMTASWIWSPKSLRPTTRMPHYFMQENNSSRQDIQRTRIEVAAMAHYLMNAEPGPTVADNPPVYKPRSAPEEPGDVDRGRELLHRVGCLACHTNLNEHGRQWIVDDLVDRQGLDQEQAKEHHDEQMNYNQRHQYVLEHLEDRLQQTGPELSAVGTKLLAGRTPQQARDWLFNWLIDPRGYHSYTIMPRLRLTDQESADITEYLLAQTRDDYEPHDFEITGNGAAMLTELVVHLKAAQSTEDMAREEIEDEFVWPPERKLMFLGEKMISHYGCNGCHLINGFEAVGSACTTLDGWGLKDPHKLDFGHFQHAFDRLRTEPWELHRVRGHGLTADAPGITHENDDRIEKLQVAWEQIENERRPWLYHKLHNPRVYDRARTTFDGDENTGPIDVGRPYDKLKMPRFYLTDQQARALVTYVTSIRKPLVSPQLQEVFDEAGQQVVRGRQLATRYNCYGCHNIEGNDVHIHQYFGVYDDDRFINEDAMNWAPPRLLGQGAKIQGDWLFGFLQNVQPIRNWLRIRMPSFPMTEDDARMLTDYFMGHSRILARSLEAHLKVIDDYRNGIRKRISREEPIGSLVKRLVALEVLVGEATSTEGSSSATASTRLRHFEAEKVDIEAQIEQLEGKYKGWFESDVPTVAAAVHAIRKFAISSDLVRAGQIDPRYATEEELNQLWNGVQVTAEESAQTGLLDKVRALAGVFGTKYPYTPAYDPETAQDGPDKAERRFARSRELFKVMGCMDGLCHRVGDDHLLARHKMLAATSQEDLVDEDEEGYEDDEEEDYGEYEYGDDSEVEPASVRPDGPPGGAPNLRLVAGRLQADWVRQWLVHSDIMQPGTRMQQYFKHGKSHFVEHNERTKMESLFGNAAQQQDLLIDFLYSVGPRRVTLSPDGSIIGGSPETEIKLPALPTEAPTDDAVTPETPDASKAGPPPITPPDVPNAAPAPLPSPVTSQIPDWHKDSTAAYKGPAIQGNKTRIIGAVKFAGHRRENRPISMAADQACTAGHAHPVRTEQLVVSDAAELANALVYVKEGLTLGQAFELPDRAEIRQVGCVYQPHVTAVMVGQTLDIWNNDNTTHNVKILARKNRAENFNQATAGVKSTMKATQPEINIGMACNYHPWMSGVLHVLEHPFFSVSDAQGRFEIRGLPAGKYTLEVLHESPHIDAETFEVQVAVGTSHRAADVTVRGN